MCLNYLKIALKMVHAVIVKITGENNHTRIEHLRFQVYLATPVVTGGNSKCV